MLLETKLTFWQEQADMERRTLMGRDIFLSSITIIASFNNILWYISSSTTIPNKP